MPSRKKEKKKKKKTKVSFFKLKRRWKKQCELHYHSLSGDFDVNIRLYILYARKWKSKWVVQFINREYVLCTKSVCMHIVHKTTMMCIVLGMCTCIYYYAIEYRWWCEVERKKRRQTERKREECIVLAAVKNKSCASSLCCALDTHSEQ